MCCVHQRIQYAKSKSDAVAKQEGTYIQREKKPREKRKAPEQGALYVIDFFDQDIVEHELFKESNYFPIYVLAVCRIFVART